METKELERFLTDKNFREMKVDELKETSIELKKTGIERLRKEQEELRREKISLIEKHTNGENKVVVDNQLYVNDTAGIIIVNEHVAPFSSVKNAEIKIEETGDVCKHIGVLVDLDGIFSEIVLLDKETNQSSELFVDAKQRAENVVYGLGVVSNTVASTEFESLENFEDIKDVNKRIEAKKKQTEVFENRNSAFIFPAITRKGDHPELTDEEYFLYNKYLEEEQSKTEILGVTSEQAQSEEIKKSVSEKRTKKVSNIMPKKTVGIKIGYVFLWIISICSALLGLIFMLVQGMPVSFLCLLTAVVINPIFYEFMYKNVKKYPFWMNFVFVGIAFVLFFVVIILTYSEITPATEAYLGKNLELASLTLRNI